MAAILDFKGVSDTNESQNPIFKIYFLDSFHHARYQKSASIIIFFHIWTPIPGLKLQIRQSFHVYIDVLCVN